MVRGILIVKFMVLPSRGTTSGAKYAKKDPIFKNLLFYSHICDEKTGCIVMMSMKPSTKIVTFMAPGSGVLALGWGQYGHIVKMY